MNIEKTFIGFGCGFAMMALGGYLVGIGVTRKDQQNTAWKVRCVAGYILCLTASTYCAYLFKTEYMSVLHIVDTVVKQRDQLLESMQKATADLAQIRITIKEIQLEVEGIKKIATAR